MELSIWLDTYDDLYSDFDSRNFSKRLVSEDFIHELKRNTKEVKGPVTTLLLHIPENVRVPALEQEIIASLKRFLQLQFHTIRTEIAGMKRRGSVMSVFGFLLLIAAAALHYTEGNNFLFSAFRVIIEPASWFLVWNGLETLIYEVRNRQVPYRAFKKLKDSDIAFVNMVTDSSSQPPL